MCILLPAVGYEIRMITINVQFASVTNSASSIELSCYAENIFISPASFIRISFKFNRMNNMKTIACNLDEVQYNVWSKARETLKSC